MHGKPGKTRQIQAKYCSPKAILVFDDFPEHIIWILCLTLFFPFQDFHERKHKPEAAQSGEGFIHLRLQGGKMSKLHPECFLTGESSHGRMEPLELADGELRPSRHQVENKKTSQFHFLCCQSNQLWQHPDSQREQHQNWLPRGQLCQVIHTNVIYGKFNISTSL